METTRAHQLRRVGLRVTRPRLPVPDVPAARPHAAAAIVTAAREQNPTLRPADGVRRTPGTRPGGSRPQARHPELDFDPLDDTGVWPENDFEPRLVGTMTLDRNVTDHHDENEQSAFGTGVLVDGMDVSDDKIPVGRTFTYSDTQRYRVGPHYLQLPIGSAKNAVVQANQRGGRCRSAWTSAPARTRM
jgi:hypothetical protein